MRTTVNLLVHAIVTLSNGDQLADEVAVVIPANVTHDNVHLVEADIVEQVIDAARNDCNVKDIVKISLCYLIKNTMFGRGLIEPIVKLYSRSQGKYYFNPEVNDLDNVEKMVIHEVINAS